MAIEDAAVLARELGPGGGTDGYAVNAALTGCAMTPMARAMPTM
jgi:hypothetical protein